MFAPHRMYVHEAFRDVAIHVVKSFYVKEKRLWKLKVQWVSVRRGFGVFMGSVGPYEQKLEIRQDDLSKWKRIHHDYTPQKIKHRVLTFEQGRIQETFVGE